MSKLYSKEHEWVQVEGDVATVGITQYAAEALGDVVFVDIEATGSVAAGDVVGTIESVKSVSDIFAPISGEITEVNGALTDTPDLVNESPEGDAWLFKVKLGDKAELDALLSDADYDTFTKDA